MLNTNELKTYIGPENLTEVNALLENCQLTDLKNLHLKSSKVTLLLSIFLGMFGIDRLYQGGGKMMFYKLVIVFMSLGTWWIADIFYSVKAVQAENKDKILGAVA